MIFAFKVLFPSFFKVDLHSANVGQTNVSQSPFEANEMLFLLNRFVLFANHEQPQAVFDKVVI